MEKEKVNMPQMTKNYSANNLPEILRNMADYAEECMRNGEDIGGYFVETVNSGLFHDSEGKVLQSSEESVTFVTDY